MTRWSLGRVRHAINHLINRDGIVEEAPFAFINYTEEVGLMQNYIGGWFVHPHGSAAFQDAHLITKNK